MATEVNWVIDQGSYFEEVVTVKSRNGELIGDITGYAVRGQARLTLPGSTVEFSLTGDIPDGPNSASRFFMQSADTTNLTPGDYVFDGEIYSGIREIRVVQGIITVNPQVTR